MSGLDVMARYLLEIASCYDWGMSSILRERKQEIEKIVEQIRLDTGLSYPDNSLRDISAALGADVISVELPPFEDKKVKGFIQWFTPEQQVTFMPYKAKIFLNADQTDSVRNFTFAHELGHFLLHKDGNKFRMDFQDYSKEGDPENSETEANFFAGSLLMPKDKFEAAIKAADSLDEVATAFAVSRPAVESRLKWLGWKLV